MCFVCTLSRALSTLASLSQLSLALFKDFSDTHGGVYGSTLKPHEVTMQMMAVEGCLSAGIPLHVLGNPVFKDFLHHAGVRLPAAGNLSNYIPVIEKKEVSVVCCLVQCGACACTVYFEVRFISILFVPGL